MTEPLTLEDLRSTYYEASDTASTIIRQLAFVGLGFVWVFSGGNGATAEGSLHIPSDLLRVGLLLAIALTVDLLQYLWKTLIFGFYASMVEQKRAKFTDGTFPSWFNYPSLVFFWGKAMLMAVAYVLLALALNSRIH
jgi:hypothetical protein